MTRPIESRRTTAAERRAWREEFKVLKAASLATAKEFHARPNKTPLYQREQRRRKREEKLSAKLAAHHAEAAKQSEGIQW